MSIPVPLRTDFNAGAVRRAAKASKDAAQGRRLLALAEIYEGGTRTDAARIGGVGLQTIRDWVLAFNRGGPDGLVNLAGCAGPRLNHHRPPQFGLHAIVLPKASRSAQSQR